MNTLYIECNMGAAGDMLMAALSELIPDPDAWLEEMNHIGLHGVKVEKETRIKCGIAGTGICVKIYGAEEGSVHQEQDHQEPVHEHGDESAHSHSHDSTHSHGNDSTHSHSHSGMIDILHRIHHLKIGETVKKNAEAVYRRLAEAEAFVHQTEIKDIHFHEVGTMDAVADIVGVCMLVEKINPDRILVSPVHTGCGQVRCAHGLLPVPAPATAKLLEGIPSYSTGLKGELCTPTGAALLKHFADGFGGRPVMTVSKTGYGMGKKDFEAANCVRVFVGEEMV